MEGQTVYSDFGCLQFCFIHDRKTNRRINTKVCTSNIGLLSASNPEPGHWTCKMEDNDYSEFKFEAS